MSELSSSASSSHESAGSGFMFLGAVLAFGEICSLDKDDCRAWADDCAILSIAQVHGSGSRSLCDKRSRWKP